MNTSSPNELNVEEPTELMAFLFASRPEVKRTKVRQWVKFGSILVNGQPATRSNHPLQTGDSVTILGKGEAPTKGQLPRGMKVVFEDASLIVIDKPANLLSMASPTERTKTAYAILTNYVRCGNRHSLERVWIVHRLDRETSGLMVFAKTEAAKTSLQENWDQVEKRYLAVVDGEPPADQGVLTSHLDEGDSFKVYSGPPNKRTRKAVTHYQVVTRSHRRVLLELTLETGRRHQIRVQLADIDCPVIGDEKYEARTNPIGRLGLHSSSLRFNHPVSGEPLKFSSTLPRDLRKLLQG